MTGVSRSTEHRQMPPMLAALVLAALRLKMHLERPQREMELSGIPGELEER